MRRRWPRRRARSLLVVVVLALLALLRWWQDQRPGEPGLPGERPSATRPAELPTSPGSAEDLPPGEYRVARVVDGDTLLLENQARVRLLGVDTPETVRPDSPVEPWGPEAAAFTRSFLGKQAVRLEFDRERVDDYGRYLAYVWIGDRMLNEELLRAGLGRALLRHPYAESRKRAFRRAQQEAQSAERGIWSDSAPAR